ncbi:MAG: hypothetical protein KKB70_09860 [Proteobacteria bacterium]|nr:hypothetical protein [Pseudomonadota bacterium]
MITLCLGALLLLPACSVRTTTPPMQLDPEFVYLDQEKLSSDDGTSRQAYLFVNSSVGGSGNGEIVVLLNKSSKEPKAVGSFQENQTAYLAFSTAELEMPFLDGSGFRKVTDYFEIFATVVRMLKRSGVPIYKRYLGASAMTANISFFRQDTLYLAPQERYSPEEAVWQPQVLDRLRDISNRDIPAPDADHAQVVGP